MSGSQVVSTFEELQTLLASRARAGLRVGELLVAAGLVSEVSVQAALQARRQGGQGRLGEILVAMGVVARSDIEAVIEQQTGVPLLDLQNYTLNPLALLKLSAPAAVMYGVLPVDLVDGSLVVVFAKRPAQDEIAAVRFASGHAVIALQATNPSLLETLVRSHYANPSSTFVRHSHIARDKYVLLADSGRTTAGFFRYLIAHAIANGASDLHLRPVPDGSREVLMRVDGLFRPVRSVSASEVAALVRHIELLSGIDFLSRTAPKEGRLEVEFEGRQVDLRVSVIEGVSGDSVVLRVLDPRNFPDSLEDLALPAAQLRALSGILVRPHGLLVAVGPTGSGKTTTLYTLLKELQARNLHVVTAEDPVEFRLPGINQFESRDFASLLPRLLRHDPDVVMVGELRDEKTVAMALGAALTGHLVLSTVHANDSAATIHRLLGLGAPLHVLTSCLAGILSQRLVRLNCPACHGKGCGTCAHTGFSGRTLVAELAKPRKALADCKDLPTHAEITRHLEFLGGTTLDASILDLARTGRTSWTEAAGLVSDPQLLPVEMQRALGYSDAKAA